ncbi:MAG: glycoside hydrolase family 9 protein [Spirochaetales bacterium]|nr:glycoside hydrolase family 9 protein [Spirochaetales bacterium]
MLRYASNEAGLGYLTYKLCGYNGFITTANFIMDYTLGSNPRNGSYVTNYLNNPPRHPHRPPLHQPLPGTETGCSGNIISTGILISLILPGLILKLT